MTPPRQILPGQLCFVTVRAVNRCFRFTPKRRTVQIIWYCLARTLDKYRERIAIHEFLWMSNHYHLVLTDVTGCLPRFMEELNSLLSRALNALHGIHGTTIEKGYNLVSVTGDDKLLEHCVYTLANPCSAHLVKRSRHWKSVSSRDLEYGVPVTIERPEVGLWGGPCRHIRRAASLQSKRARHGGRSKLPQQVQLVLVRPLIMRELADDAVRQHIRERLDQREVELARERRARGARVLGWSAATRTDFRAVPAPEQRFGTVPSYSATTAAGRIAAWQRRGRFLAAYYDALRRFVLGDRQVAFPIGTWLMRARFGVRCESAWALS